MKSIYALVGIALLWCALLVAHDDPVHVKLAEAIMQKHIQAMTRRGFSLTVIGGGMVEDIHFLSLRFSSTKTPTLAEARIMYVNGMQSLLALVNGDPAIRPYLRNYPFGVENVRYGLSFPDVPIDSSGYGPIAHVFCNRQGKICYSRYDPALEGTNPLFTAHCESYPEALLIVREAGALEDLNNMQ